MTSQPQPLADDSTAQFDDYFALFALPISFDIDVSQLDNSYRRLQKQYHPDKISATEQAKKIDTLSAVINNAYQTLKAADSRASYLLELQDQADGLNNSIADFDFLDDAMTLRMDLDDAINGHDLPTLEQLKPSIAQRLQQQSQRFADAYQQQDWVNATDAAQKLKFLVKLNADVLAGIDTVANYNESGDDDLYL